MDDVGTEELTVSLPSEVITEILTRLPVRSILRFKSVCKSWYALFSDPIFVKQHLKASSENKDYANHRLMFSFVSSSDVKSCSIPSVLHGECSTADPMDYPGRYSVAQVLIVGSVNGLVFITVDKVGLFLWNPATRESKKLPPNGFGRHERISYGFGYDESSSDYKVVGINDDGVTNPSHGLVKIYGLKSDSWKSIGNVREYVLMAVSGKFVSGALHWPMLIGTGMDTEESTLSLNLSDETFFQISLPQYGDRSSVIIDVLNGCLCALCLFDETNSCDVWLWKEDGEIASWYKMFSVTFQPDRRSYHSIAPFFNSRENEVILMVTVNLVLYNVETETISVPRIRDLSTISISEGNTYIETLVSPHRV